MNNPEPDAPFDKLEANLRALGERVPDLPFSGILLCRLVLHLGRQMAAGFEQRLRPFGLVEAARRRRASKRFVRASGPEPRQHVAHQRCPGEP